MSGESGRLLVRTWNLFHGNTVPPGRRAYLQEMVELATADRPSILCLQEVPVWALASLARWSGMTAFGAVAARPRLRSAELGRWLTELNHGLFRSAFTGQANAILVDRRAREEQTVVVSRGGERRVCQTVRVDRVLVANLHVTPGTSAESQLDRALAVVADEEGPVVVAGDANLRPDEAGIYPRLRAAGFSEPLAGSIDQIVVRGLPATAPVAWPEDRRRVGGRLLSDHAPVELTVG